MLPKLAEMGAFFPKIVSKGPCQEVVRTEGFSLFDYPILKCWPEDGGRFITLPLVFSRNPDTGKRNCGMYRIQAFDERTAGMHWQTHKQGAEHYRRLAQQGRTRMDVAVAIGADPPTMYSAILPLPPDLDEMMIAGFLRQSPVEMVKCQTCDLEVPAHAEIVLEGYVELGELRTEGPFGDHTGFYSLADEYPVFHLTCVTQRKDPIYATTIVGPPPMEDAWLGKATERLFLPLLRMMFPEVLDMNLPVEGAFHNLVIVKIKKGYPFHAQRVAHGLWGAGQMMFSKVICVVDHDVDVQNLGEVAWRLLANMDPKRDMSFVDGPIDQLDHGANQALFGGKVCIDGTRKWKEEGYSREWPEVARMSADVEARVDAMWSELGIDRARSAKSTNGAHVNGDLANGRRADLGDRVLRAARELAGRRQP
jgi:4-hydroxy-3-polyprenylbenzoate decarboxylase